MITMKRTNITGLLAFMIAVMTAFTVNAEQWTGTWASAQERPYDNDMPKNSLSGKSLRQIVHVSLGGEKMRLQLSNEFGSAPVEIKSVYIADGSGKDIDASTAKYLTFNKKKNVVIQPGETIYSDPVDFVLKPLQLLSVTVNYGDNVPEVATTHRGSRTNSYIAEGAVSPDKKFIPIESLPHWYNIAKIEVMSDAPCVGIIGDSITDGRGSTTDEQDRWTDALAEAFGGKIGVLNLGIGGNALVSGGLSEPALKRFDRDILGQQGLTHIIIFEGTNDIGGSHDGRHEQTCENLKNGLAELIKKSNDKGCKVYLATITPVKGGDYFTHWHEAIRQNVNEWIRNNADIEGVIDFDKLVRDPSDTQRLQEQFSSDWLHLNPLGYAVMGKYAAEKIR